MEQATQTTAPAPTAQEPRPPTFDDAHAVVPLVVNPLEQQPFAVETEEDWPSGYRVHLKFRETRGAGLLEFAALVDVPVTRADTAFGTHLDAITRVRGIEVRGSALVRPWEADRLLGTPTPEPMRSALAAADQAAAQPVPLGTGTPADLPAIVSVLPHPGAEDEPACVRCGCTNNAACQGGCYWVPNLQMLDLCSACATADELAAMSFIPAELPDGEQAPAAADTPEPAPMPRLASPLMDRIAVTPAVPAEDGQA
ncbi:hypothetical protein [Streptomyces sp. NBC_00620]|uniref:hypothetical protein n=1 Tax=Streptomyces sp. NBC_00620 TaxID=2903666 RepID=UPI00224F4280|nr:hypothetical protein [Streptomyces sp. NBC_00620]MCX4974275.1 hypothetical protein [Streptomyces sp. NBC_00620]